MIFTFILILIFTAESFSKSDTTYSTDEVIISSSRYEENIDVVNAAISVVSKNKLEINNPLNLANALFGEVGIWMQQTNHGGGSPFLRGLTGNQTLIMIDGIRLNNSTFRYGPNQYLNTINVNEIQRIEILRGSGSVQFGSDALGGVVHIITKSPKIGLSNQINSGLQLKYLSSDMEKSANAYLNYSTSNSGYHTSISFKKFGDIVAGKGLNKEAPSSYDEYSLNIKNSHRVFDKVLLTYNYQYFRQNDVDRFDQVAQRGYEYYKFDPQIRQFAYLKSELFSENKFAKKISLTFSWQKSDETRITKKNNTEIETTANDVVNTLGANLLVFSQINKNWIINSGIEYYFDYINSFSKTLNVKNNCIVVGRGLYSNASKFYNFSIFSLSNYTVNNFDLGAGVRYNLASLVINDDVFGKPKINPDAVSGHLSLAYSFNKKIKLITKINSAYRIPNINDVSSFGLFDYGIEVPNNNLSPEKSLNYEIGLKLNTSILKASVFLFRADLKNLISRIKTTYNSSILFNGDRVYKKENIGKAFIQGIEFKMKYSPHNDIILSQNITYTYGQDKSKNEPIRRIPPLNGSLALLYNVHKSIAVRAEFLFAFKQNRLSPSDIDDHRISDGGTPGWSVLNIYSNYYVKPVVFGFGINNIFNEPYRMHGSGIDGIGRSFQFVVKYNY